MDGSYATMPDSLDGDPMDDQTSLEMYKRVLETCEAEYDGLTRIFQILDSKAQATAATAGVFLAAAFAFVRDLRGKTAPPAVYTSIFVASLSLLLVAVFFALLATWIQHLMSRPTVEFVRKLIIDLVTKEGSEAIGSRATGFFGDETREWIPALQRMRIVVRRKGRFVAYSQLSLLLSLVCVSALTITYVIRGD